VRSLRNAILCSWSAVSPSMYWREKMLIYVLRQRTRREEGEESVPSTREELLGSFQKLERFIVHSLGRDMEGPVPIADALVLIKFLKGGAW